MALDTVAGEVGNEDEFEELAYEHFDAETALSGYQELGVTGLCIALNAAGGVTAVELPRARGCAARSPSG